MEFQFKKAKQIQEQQFVQLKLSFEKIKHKGIAQFLLDNYIQKNIEIIHRTNSVQEFAKQLPLLQVSRGKQSLFLSFAQDQCLKQNESHFIAESLPKLSNIISSLEIELQQQQIPKHGLNMIFSSLLKLSNMQKLRINLKENQLGGVQHQKIYQFGVQPQQICNKDQKSVEIEDLFFKLSKFQQLSILELILDTTYIETSQLSKSLSSLQNLTQLCLSMSDNNIDAPQLSELVEGISNLKQLHTLNLDIGSNYFENKGMEYLVKYLPNLVNLTSLNLNLSFNQLTQKESSLYVVQLITLLSGLTHLKLSLWGNDFEDEGVQQIEKAISGLDNLKSLDLNFYFNGVSDEVAIEVQKKLEENKYDHFTICF